MKTLTKMAAVPLLLISSLLVACNHEPKLEKGATTMAVEADTVAVIETKPGNLVVEFYDADAPKTVANFRKLTTEGF